MKTPPNWLTRPCPVGRRFELKNGVVLSLQKKDVSKILKVGRIYFSVSELKQRKAKPGSRKIF